MWTAESSWRHQRWRLFVHRHTHAVFLVAFPLLQVFWTNGGPGCSSVGGGLFSESGPFRPNAAGGLSPNPWTWSSAANMLYVEQPAGVGFSYSNNTADYTVGDARAADDVFWFLQGFMKAFPQFAAAPLWITGESYGGHYVPSIARCGATAGGCPFAMTDAFLVAHSDD